MIYFMKLNEFVKIGYSAKPKTRLAEIRVASPYPVDIIGVMEGTRYDEARLHTRFDPHHHGGDWFRLVPEIETFIAENCRPMPTRVRSRMPKVRENGTVAIGFQMPIEKHKLLGWLAVKHNTTKGELLRIALQSFIARQEAAE